MRSPQLFAFGAFVSTLLVSAIGCELFATVDRSQIPGSGGFGDASVASSTTSATSTSGTGGSGGVGGVGGTGGVGGVGGSSSSTGGGAPCMKPTDCADPKNECVTRTCTNQQCGLADVASGAPTATQKAGDCKKTQCDGKGAAADVNDDSDLPDDKNDCTDDVCTNGVASNPPKAASSPCGMGGALHCDGAGQCVGCAIASDCAGMDTDCSTRTCKAGVCGTLNDVKGKPVTAQTAGDCQLVQCDGNGGTESVADNGDVPVDNETCTQDLCNAGAPSNPPEAAGKSCMEGTGTQCDGAGKCAECLAPTDCPGTDDECQQRTCTAGVCGKTFTAAGTALAAQTAGDCQKAVCDGSGGTTQNADDTDLPNDNNACTDEVCTNGVPSHPTKPDGQSCGGTLTCLSGACTGCSLGTDCPGTDDECKTRTCTVGVCGQTFTANNTPLSMQAMGDCQKAVCDGSGNTVSVPDNADVPVDDGNQCTGEVCSNGSPTHPNQATNTPCSQMGGSFCNATGQCVACNAASQCPGMDTDCKTRSCTANACGFSFASVGTVTTTQTPGDCQVTQCDGSGGTMSVASNGDVPADDGVQCTGEVCTNGVPSHPPKAINIACNQNGGAFCDGSGACVACNAAAQCPGQDTDCHTRTCVSGSCGANQTAAGTPTSIQTSGDCQENQCDGAGNSVSVAKNADVPADDGNVCTGEVCTSGAPSHPNLAFGTACGMSGSFCDGAGTCTSASCSDMMKNGTESDTDCGGTCPGCTNGKLCGGNGDCASNICAGGVCVECTNPTQCPGVDTDCSVRTCSSNVCGVSLTAAGTPTSVQTSGDCQQNQCDGAGNSVSVAFNTDVPVDSNQCTDDLCTAGVPTNPFSALGTVCNQGGTQCDGAGSCISAPAVASTSPTNGASAVASTPIAVTFTIAMNPATLTGQTTAGACSGSIQVSLDGFASCIAFSSASAAMTAGNTVATFTAAPGLLVNRTYAIRVTTAATAANGLALPAQFDQLNGFGTTSPNLCDGSLVMSQVYGGGGSATATYKNDYIEIYNRGTTSVSLTGKSIQYASAAGTSWSVALLGGTVPAGGYFLVQLGGNSGLANLPAPDFTPVNAINMSGTAGKVALMNTVTATPNGNACPTAAQVIDFVGFGATASCFEGAAAAPAPSTTTSLFRNQAGCGDVNTNSTDLTAAAPSPRNSATAPATCACLAQNESNVGLEADYCDLQFPLTLSVQTGTSTGNIFGQVFESGVTDPAGASGSVRAQLGYGPTSANPEYEAGWTWTNATFNTQVGNNDEYQASFTAPAVGTYGYVYRVSVDQGVSWTYCDQNAGDFGAGSNTGLTFDFANEGVLTVTP